jgi:hypothetical protein
MNNTDLLDINAVDDSPLTDRELLVLAARATGVQVVRSRLHDPACKDMLIKAPASHHSDFMGWNPLTDDGDSKRLLVALPSRPRMTITSAGVVIDFDTEGELNGSARVVVAWAEHSGDKDAAVRRAITVAAATYARATMPFNVFILMFPGRFAPERVERARQLVAGREVQS